MSYIEEIKKGFDDATVVLKNFLSNEKKFIDFEKAAILMVDALKNSKKIISCGNGGSMSDAMHFAEELSGRFRNERPAMAAIAISDASHITCVANDYGFEHIFSRYVEALGQEGDILLAISTSGNSGNIVNAVHSAHKKGMKVVALTGKTGGELAKICDIEIRVEWNGYSDRIQEVHIKIIHSLIHYIEMAMA